jgi:hypothetical protein
LSDLRFVNTTGFDYRLTPTSPVINKGLVLVKKVKGRALQPAYEYRDTCNYSIRTQQGNPDIGAFEYINNTSYVPGRPTTENIRYSLQNKTLVVHSLKNKDIGFASVYCAQGKLVFSEFSPVGEHVNSYTLNLQHCKQGIYTLVLFHNSGAINIIRVLVN